MFTRIQDIEDIQGGFIRRILGGSSAMPLVEPLTPAMVAEAHAQYLPTRPGAPIPHQSVLSVVMFIVHGRWKGLCPECSCGVTTGRGWDEARCFECGAILRATWPAERAQLEANILTRIPRDQQWHPDQE